MSRRKSFVYDMFPQDFNDGVKGFTPATIGIYVMLINLMRVEGGPLPPRRLKKPRDEFDEWIRDKLNLKNVKTWLKAKAELLADPDKLVELPDGRVANPRTERDMAKRGGGSGDSGDGQNVLPFDRAVDASVDDSVGDAGERVASTEVIDNFRGSSANDLQIRARKPLKSLNLRCALPYPYIHIPHEAVVAASTVAVRARGDPTTVRA
jgi:hypothetical protein